MKAMCLLGPECFELREDYPEPPEPGAGEAVIRLCAVGICGSDLHLYSNGQIGNLGGGESVVPGHEFMGEVLAAGTDSRDGFGGRLEAGQRVAVEPHIPCGTCEWCQRGDVNLCPRHTFIGLPGSDGALRERMTVPARNAFPVPDSISDAGGALLEPLGVALHAVDLAGRLLAKDVAVIGCGPIGLLVLRLCRLAGAGKLVGIDPNPARLAVARRWGATHTLEGTAADRLPAAMTTVADRGFDRVFECAWTGEALPPAVRMAAPGARILMVGIPAEDEARLPHSVARRKGLTLVFVRRMKHTYGRAIRLTDGPAPAVALDELVSHRFPLTETPRAFALNAAYDDNVLKVVIEP